MKVHIKKIGLLSAIPVFAIVAGLFSYGKAHAANTNTTKIDTLSYFMDTSGVTLNGTHQLSQTVSGNDIYWTKWDNDAYEHYSYDNNYIYLREDHSGETSSYTYSSGRWLARQMSVGQQINVTDNYIQRFNVGASSCTPTVAGFTPYVMTLTQHLPSYNAGGTLGTRDVIVVEYDYRAGFGTQYEKYYFAKGIGLIKWQLYNNNQVVQTSTFNTITTAPPVPPNLTNACGNTPVTSDIPTMPTSLSGLVNEMYTCILDLNVPTTDPGFQYWLGNLQSGALSIPSAYGYFFENQPDHLPDLTDAQFASKVYTCILFRDIDPSSLATITTDLGNGSLTRAQLVQSVLNSDEFNNHILPFLPKAQ